LKIFVHFAFFAVNRLIKLKSPPSVRDERGVSWCHPGRSFYPVTQDLRKILVVMQQGLTSFTLFRYGLDQAYTLAL